MHRLSSPLPLAICAVAFCAGAVRCGDGGGGPDRIALRDERELVAAPQPLVEACRRAARRHDFVVLCPSQVPPPPQGAEQHVRPGDFDPTGAAYLLELSYVPQEGTFHVLIGGRRDPFPLATRGDRWPATVPLDHDLRLIGRTQQTPTAPGRKPIRPRLVTRTRIAGTRALILRVAPYPDGGVHGGHYAAIWNQDGHGYLVSIHVAEMVSVAAIVEDLQTLASTYRQPLE
jgi:hypothetical protein